MTTSDSARRCYHCGEAIPAGVSLSAQVNGAAQPMCCAGCQAVCEAIVAGGLADYYLKRDALPESQREALPESLTDLLPYDHPAFQQGFVRRLEGDGDVREAALILEGITCAACIWLNEQHLARLPGVLGAEMNYASRRARISWDESRIKLSEILAAIAAIGYRAHPYDAERSEALAKKERKAALWRVFVAGFGMMQVMMYALPAYVAGDGEIGADIGQLLRWASCILTVPVVFYSAAPFFRNAWRDLRRWRVGMDVPVALGVGAAFVASLWATFTASGEVYFDSVTMFVFFLLTGRYLEMIGRQKAQGLTEELARLLPLMATRLPGYPASQAAEAVPASELACGDVVLVRPGESIPADGVVVAGASRVDESLLSGESRPLAKAVGDQLVGGAINGESPLTMRVREVGEAMRVSAIVRLMERAASQKPRIVELADVVAARFVMALLAVAALVAVAWYLIDPSKALWITVSVLVVTCPCALSLATPVALAVASGAFARVGLLVTRSSAIETLARADHFVFDKTGTLTRGNMHLLKTLPLGARSESECLLLAAALESSSEHPLARAIIGALPAGAALPALDAVRATAGSGIAAWHQGREVRIGRPEWVAALHGEPLPPAGAALLASDDTLLALADASGWLALFCVGDELRPEAADLIAGLRAAGCTVSLLTGDAQAVATRVAAELGIADVHAEVTPQGKHAFVRQMQELGKVVAMVGDGVNDAPVLAQAHVSVAMGGGAALARTQADFVLLGENLDVLRQGQQLAQRTLAVVRQNLVWSFAYNFIALPLAMLGYVTPWMAGIGMSGSSLLVVFNSLRLGRRKI